MSTTLARTLISFFACALAATFAFATPPVDGRGDGVTIISFI